MPRDPGVTVSAGSGSQQVFAEFRFEAQSTDKKPRADWNVVSDCFRDAISASLRRVKLRPSVGGHRPPLRGVKAVTAEAGDQTLSCSRTAGHGVEST